MKKIKRYIPRRTPVSASDLNAIAAEVARLGKLSASPPLVLRSDASGVHLRLQPQREIELAEVTDAPDPEMDGGVQVDDLLPVARVRPSEWLPAVPPASRELVLRASKMTKVGTNWWNMLVPDLDIGDRLFITHINGEWIALAPFENDP